jgi:hypothetical protein
MSSRNSESSRHTPCAVRVHFLLLEFGGWHTDCGEDYKTPTGCPYDSPGWSGVSAANLA